MTDWFKPDPVGDTLPTFTMPAAGFLETVEAARKGYDAQRLSTTRNFYARRLGKDVVAALRQRGRTGFTGADGRQVRYGDDALRSDYVLNPTVGPRIWQDVEAERQRDPGFLKGIGSADEFEAAILTARRRDFDESNEVLGRSGGITGLAGELAGGLIAAAEDPLQIGAMAVTGGLPAGRLGLGVLQKLFGGRLAMGTATRIGSEALGNAIVNVAATAPTLPVAAARSAEIGVELSARDIAMELGVAGIAGGVLGGGAAALGAGASAAGKAMSARRMARELRKLDRPLTGPEADALVVLEQAAIDIAASPFPATVAGDAAHGERLTEAVDALENDRPMDPAVFDKPAPDPKDAVAIEAERAVAAVPAFDPTPYLAGVRDYLKDRSAGAVTPEAIGAKLGISTDEAWAALSRFSSGREARGLVLAGKAKDGGVQAFRRPPRRLGPVDLLTMIGDAGGIARTGLNRTYETRKPGARGRTFDKGHDLIGTLGQRMIPGVGPLLRKNGGMTLDQLGEFLHERGWFPGQARPTEAEVLDLLDSAAREKRYHPDEANDVMDDGAAAADAAWEADMRGQIADAARDMEVEFGDEAGIRAVLLDAAGGMEPGAAIEAHIQQQLDEAVFEARATLDDDDYLAAILGDDYGPANSDQSGAGDRSELAPAPGDAQQGGDGGAQFDGATADPAGTSAVDAAAGAEALETFDTPGGAGQAAQVEALLHDLRAEVEAGPRPPNKVATTNPVWEKFDGIIAPDDKIIGYNYDGVEIRERPNGDVYNFHTDGTRGLRPRFGGDLAPVEAAPIGDTATGSLGLDAEQAAPEGGMTERQRSEMAARLQQEKMRRGGQQSADQISGGLFDAQRDQLDAFAMPDGRTVSTADLLAEIDADAAAVQQLRGCL